MNNPGISHFSLLTSHFSLLTFYFSLLTSLFSLFAFSACSSEAGLEREESIEREAAVTLLVSHGGLGDNGYNDAAADGVFAFAHQSGVHLRLLQPKSAAEAQAMFRQWLTDNADKDSAVLILASSEYESLVKGEMDNGPLDLGRLTLQEWTARPEGTLDTSRMDNFSGSSGRRILLFESDAEIEGVSTVMISRYGVSWLAGALSQGFDALILAAAKGIPTLEESIAGFQDARAMYAGEYLGLPCTTTLHYLADDEAGFAMPDSAYRYIAHRADEAFGYDEMIFPLLGGSVAGVVRCLNDDDFSTALMVGMDVDMKGQSHRIPFSVVIRIGDVLHSYLNDWREGREWPAHRRFGMDDGAADIVITPNFGRYLNIWDPRYADPDTFQRLYEK